MADDIEVDHLITLVEARPVLWDKTSEEYKDRNIKTIAWNSVCENLIPGFQEFSNQEKAIYGKAVVKKWTGIKDNFAKYVKKLMEINESGVGTKKVKEYHLYKQLLFLNKNDQNEPEGSIIKEERKNDDLNKQSPRRKCKSPSRSQPPRKKKNVDAFEEEFMLKLQEPENRHLSFFKAILPSLNKLSDHQTLIFQSRVLQILTDLHEPSYQGGYQTVASSSHCTHETPSPTTPSVANEFNDYASTSHELIVTPKVECSSPKLTSDWGL